MKHNYLILKSVLLFLTVLASASNVFAQNKTVSGTIVSQEDNAPIPGVNVVVKSTSTGTVTDVNGFYTLAVDDNATLVFSSIGFITQEISAVGRSVIDISLMTDTKTLSEVVVIGYGSQRKRDITSAVSNINMEDVGDVPATNVTRLIQGQAPGVVVRQRNGAPGGQFEIRVRGIGSLGAGSNPLYVVDGFPVGTSIGQNLNPNDIESISILKDAASTAIYGARGSNGVVLITTKNAKEGKTSLNFSVDYGVQNIPDSRRVKVLNGVEFAQFKKEVFSDRWRYDHAGVSPTDDQVPAGFRFPEQTQHSTDWYEQIMHNNAPYTDYNMTLSSGSGAIKSVLSLGYFKEQGTIIETQYDRLSARANLGGQINRFINVGFNINGTYTKQNHGNNTNFNGRDQIVGSTLLMDPREPVYNEDGTLRPYIGGPDGVFGYPNPVFYLRNVTDRRLISDVLTNVFVEFSITKSLKFRSSVNGKLNYLNNKFFQPSTIGNRLGSGSSGAPPKIAQGSEANEQLYNISTDQLLTYAPNLGADHQFDALVGYTAQQEKLTGVAGSGNTYPDDLVPFLGAAVIRSSNSYQYEWSLLAYLARVNYSFKDKYLLSASIRREGSSRFGDTNKWGTFPAASVGWRLTEESFMPKAAWLTDLKLRASWGMTGNNDTGNYGNYPAQAFMNTSNYILGNAIASGRVVSSFANVALGWEKSNQTDLGMDLALFDNKLVITAEFYKKITNDMLLPISIPAVSGFTTSLANIGKVENKGIELAADYKLTVGAVNFRTNANIAFNRSKILAIKGANDMLYYGGFYGGYNVQKVGRPIGMIYGYRKLGIFNTQEEIDAWPTQDGVIPGGMKFWDANGDGIISYDTQDMVEIGNPNPAFTWAWSVNADYKRFDFNIMFMGAHDYDVYRNIEASTMNMDGVFNVLDKAKDRWRSPENPGSNPNHKNSQGGTNYFKWSRESSERYVYDASHFWLKNISLGYALPKLGNAISSARIFVNVSNLFLFTDYPGNNPDASLRVNTPAELNNDDESYPVPRTFAVGASINF
jgi:TonB-linked SusC/RagA family outer membrane protein